MASKRNLSPVVLLMAAIVLLAGGWLMTSFPIFIFFALSPLFALTDRASTTSTVWEKMEWVLLAQVISFLAARQFDFSYTVSSMVYGILFTLPFIGQVWVRQVLGSRVGKITIVLLWLALEYALLKVRSDDNVFLADALRLQPEWLRWNIHTGYLGASLWILMTNWLVYLSVLSEKPFQWYWIAWTVAFLAGPIAYSYFLHDQSIGRGLMMNLYSGKSIVEDVTYLARGEFVVRTAAWLSTLILLFTFVKSQTTKR